MKLLVEITGKEFEDLSVALCHVQERVLQGFTEFADTDEDGNYFRFEIDPSDEGDDESIFADLDRQRGAQ
jgi:hypothetical protein